MAARNLNQLMKHSLRLKGNICETHPNRIIEGKDYVDTFSTDKYAKYPHTYCLKKQTVVFVDCSLNVFVTPYTRKTMAILNGNGFLKANYYVPFKGLDYPTDHEYFWRNLLIEAFEQRDEEFFEDCRKHSSLHGFGELNEEDLMECLEIPYEGAFVETRSFFTRVYPMAYDFSTCKNFIGTFDCFNGYWIFVYFDGKTYITRSKDVIAKLKKVGYVRADLFRRLREREMVYKGTFMSV